mmetsp:Transcript_5698/g.10467  ORF Transcript_5698/g.10467 Transcript_5698/m.10467 type:complete len:170 (+) Transcript_5698:582-1091(+)|eukprot:CAMPEP_0197515554 /NCGR_PEP_ID=MMETSP1318-20131121/651_1 /TAXON_ID=552666 /ORGANISM="Partenskyella glossopodia, Strain RCC365" /LENGTH=169 /DNA_ID=CAMNT_0043063959 /DNA_START=85 /DNA_END=594 /DNA_ORIENTATION=-
MDQQKVEGLEQIEGSHCKMKSVIMLKGRPAGVCKVSFAKPGKHGHVKCNIVAQDLLKPDKKYQHMCPGHEMIPVPVVKKYDLIISYFEEEKGQDAEVTGICTMTEDDEEITINFDGTNEKHVKALKLFKEIEENDEDKEVVLSIVQCTVGLKGPYNFEHAVDKVNVRDA